MNHESNTKELLAKLDALLKEKEYLIKLIKEQGDQASKVLDLQLEETQREIQVIEEAIQRDYWLA